MKDNEAESAGVDDQVMTHYAYVAASGQLLEWSRGELGKFAVKVGTSRNPANRVQFLRGTNPYDGTSVPSCCNCRDWDLAGKVLVDSEEQALDLEERFKAAFGTIDVFGRQRPPFLMDDRSAGEGDLVLLPDPPLQGAALSVLDDDVRDLYIRGRSGMHRAILPAPFPEDDDYVDDEEREHRTERRLHDDGEADTRTENMDRAEKNREDGSYYED